MLDDHGFAKRGVVFHERGLFMMIGGESLAYLDPSEDDAAHYASMRVVDPEGREWRVASWKKLALAWLRYRLNSTTHAVELEQTGNHVSVEALRAQIKAAMTPAAFEHSSIHDKEQRVAMADVEAATSYEELIEAIRRFV